MATMQAVVLRRYGGPANLKLATVERPSPGPDEALVRVRATSVNSADVEQMKGMSLIRVAAPFRPAVRILGSDVAGVVEQVGPGVDGLAVGDEVFADLSEHGFGCFAEYVVAPAAALAPKPPTLGFEEAAAVPSAGVIAMQGIRDYRTVGPGSRVLVNGAGGGMGTFAVQLAVEQGAHVTGVDRAAKLDAVRSIGASEVIDFEQVDYTTTGERYDLILDVQARRSVFEVRRALADGGAYVAVGGSTPRVLQVAAVGPMLARGSGQLIGLLMGKFNRRSDIDALTELLERGAIHPVIDSTWPLHRTDGAMAALAAGEVTGKAVISLD